MKLRIKFSKTGAMKFIGHLDIMRYFQKAVRRAGIDIAYSGGFSAHQIMSFAAPLGVGLESIGEYFDIEVYSYSSCEEVKNKLNDEMVEGVEILAVNELNDVTVNAMASVKAASYRIKSKTASRTDWVSLFVEFLSRESIAVTKKTKKSEKVIELKEFIFECKAEQDCVTLLVNASSSGNIKPGFIMEIFREQYHDIVSELSVQITRLNLFGAKEINGTVELVPLSEL